MTTGSDWHVIHATWRSAIHAASEMLGEHGLQHMRLSLRPYDRALQSARVVVAPLINKCEPRRQRKGGYGASGGAFGQPSGRRQAVLDTAAAQSSRRRLRAASVRLARGDGPYFAVPRRGLPLSDGDRRA